MTIDLSSATFEKDFLSFNLPDGSILHLNVIEEDFLYDTDKESVISRINVEVYSYDEDTDTTTYTKCPCTIGLGNDILIISTDHTEYLGKVLTPDNMQYCTIEIYE